MNGNQIREGLAHAEYLRVKALEDRIGGLEAALREIIQFATNDMQQFARDALEGSTP